MKILYACCGNADDANSWSGLVWHMRRALQMAGFEVETFDRIPFEVPLSLRILHQGHKRFSSRVHQLQCEPAVLRRAARRIERRLLETGCQAVFCPGTGVPVNTFIKRTIPVFTYLDATKRSWIQTYFGWETLCERSRNLVPWVDRQAITNNTLTIFSSDWAAAAAAGETGCAPERIAVVPFGANLSDPPAVSEVEAMIAARSEEQTLRLLFLGKEWARKGGPEAVEVVRGLRAAGLPAELDVIGCVPDGPVDVPPWVRCHRFIDRSTAEGRTLFRDLVSRSHFLLFLSRAEAFGLALCEANAFGVPCLATSVGGIPTIVREGVNGFLFPVPFDPASCVKRIVEATGDRQSYGAFARSARAEFDARLNWNVAGARLRELIENRVGAGGAAPASSHQMMPMPAV